MCNTRSNIFLRSMKTNTLSVKKLTKNLILRALRQLYAVSEIIILIRWVTPPPKVENLQFEFFLMFEFPQLFFFFNFLMSSLFPLLFFVGYIYLYMSLCPLQHSLIAISSSCFSSKLKFINLTLCHKILKFFKIFKTPDDFHLPIYIYIYIL